MRNIRKYTKSLENSIKKELARPYGFGCVTYLSQGSHNDMDWKLFEESGKSIINTFNNTNWSKIKNFTDLKNRGIAIEKAMFESTAGINTHKGLIFLQLFLAYAYVYEIRWDDLEGFIKDFSKILRKDYKDSEKAIIWKKNGLKDIRNYPLTGFIDLINLVDNIAKNPLSDTRLSLYLIANIDDTTTFHRSDLKTLMFVQNRAKIILNIDNKKTLEKEIKELNDFYVKNHISSGGVADLFTTIRTLEDLREDFYD